jgi:hypothetical protein
MAILQESKTTRNTFPTTVVIGAIEDVPVKVTLDQKIKERIVSLRKIVLAANAMFISAELPAAISCRGFEPGLLNACVSETSVFFHFKVSGEEDLLQTKDFSFSDLGILL